MPAAFKQKAAGYGTQALSVKKRLNKLFHCVNRVKVFRFKFVNTHGDVEFRIDLSNKGNNVERIENAVCYKRVLVFKVDFRMQVA